jgi:hypothetical protein
LFSIHRYVIADSEHTLFTIAGVSHYDEAAGTHTGCDKTMMYCYMISQYYVSSLVTSVGFGETDVLR